jgi:murein DD-endopeptidase MepM/ murein hydrolase activator NlpD
VPALFAAPGPTAAAAALAASDSRYTHAAKRPVVLLSPAQPKQGTLFTVTLRGANGEWEGRFAGEPLRFRTIGPGVSRAIAAVPIDGDSVTLGLALAPREARDSSASFTTQVRITRGSYRMEHLRVAPSFGTEPDSATAARMAREAAQAREVTLHSLDRPALWTMPFARPRPGRITSVFGTGREFNGAVTSRHMGTDFAGAVGAPIRAANRGIVALTGRFFLGGNVVYLDHGDGLTSAYLHMSRIDVAEGDTVSRGQIIGRVGATGRVTGPHLHWIVRYGTITVDPESVLRLKGERGA